MKFLLLAIAGLCLHSVSAQQKYSDLSDSVTQMLLGLTTKGTGYSDVHSKIGALTNNMDSKSAASSNTIQSSVLDLLNGIEKHA
jgi:hypothetical protein